jgi:hypothetical protein
MKRLLPLLTMLLLLAAFSANAQGFKRVNKSKKRKHPTCMRIIKSAPPVKRFL